MLSGHTVKFSGHSTGFVKNQVYQAATDILVYAFALQGNSSQMLDGIIGDTAVTVLTGVARAKAGATAGINNTLSVTFPVQRGKFWQVWTDITGTVTISIMPIR